MITYTVMGTSILQTLDSTIANVALPHMQGSFSASQDQMTWVLTSYIVATAIMTPLTGWLAGTYGRKNLFLVSVIAFTVTSALCGMAQSLTQIVLFRLLQGAAGAALVPMSQAVLFDINPPKDHAKAMAAWGQGVVLGPILGPVLGGWLTDNYSWRWVFYINVPFGILAVIGLLRYLPETTRTKNRFDFFGFSLLSIAVASLQLMLDRGSTKDWFSSTEIIVEATLGALCLFLFIVHSATAERPFFRPALFRDRNFIVGNIFIFVVGIVIFATLALLPPLMQVLFNYPVFTAGLVTMARGVGSMLTMFFIAGLATRFDSRLVIGLGFALAALSSWMMIGWSPLMGWQPFAWASFVQGMGTAIAYIPMAALTFATLPSEFRNEGTALFSLIRNIGSSIGISTVQALLVRNTQIMHASLAEHVTPYASTAAQLQVKAQLATPTGLAAFNAEITRQASMVAYLDDFKLMLWLIVFASPMLLLLRKPQARQDLPHVAAE